MAPTPPDRSPTQSLDETDLAVRLARGDERALAEAYDRFGALAYSLAVAMLRDPQDAEEAVSDAFSQVWRTARDFDAARGTLQAWVITVVRSRALDRLRARRRAERVVATEESVVHAAVQWAADPADGPDVVAEDGDRRARVGAALAELPPVQREALLLAYFEGLSHSEIAARLRQPLGTVKTRVRTALGRLRALLESFSAEEDA